RRCPRVRHRGPRARAGPPPSPDRTARAPRAPPRGPTRSARSRARSSRVLRETSPEIADRLVEMRLHGADGGTEHRSDVLVRHVREHLERDALARTGRKRSHRGAEPRAILAALPEGIGAVRTIGDPLGLAERGCNETHPGEGPGGMDRDP